MDRDFIINKIKSKISNEINNECISKLSFVEYQSFVLDFFNFIFQYRDDFDLNYLDFREFLDEYYYNLEFDNDDKITNRITLFIEELTLHYAIEPYFWDSSFEVFKNKILKEINPKDY